MDFNNSKIAEYTESFTSPEPEIVKKLLKASEDDLEFTDMLSGRQVGTLLKFLVQMTGAKRVLEIGTFTGYSAMMMASAMPKGSELITIERNQRYQTVSDPFFSEPPFDEIIFQIMGNAVEIVPRLQGEFDLVFLDGDKINYPVYYPMLKEKLKKGGILVVDNVLWGGDAPGQTNEKAATIHKLNQMIFDDEQAEQVMIPMRDGITIALFG